MRGLAYSNTCMFKPIVVYRKFPETCNAVIFETIKCSFSLSYLWIRIRRDKLLVQLFYSSVKCKKIEKIETFKSTFKITWSPPNGCTINEIHCENYVIEILRKFLLWIFIMWEEKSFICQLLIPKVEKRLFPSCKNAASMRVFLFRVGRNKYRLKIKTVSNLTTNTKK